MKLREERYRDQALVESQVRFSEALLGMGFNTPPHHFRGECYTTLARIGQRRYVTTVEDYIGEEGFRSFVSEDAYALGLLLGKLHAASLESHLAVGKSFVTYDILCGKADLRRVVSRYPTSDEFKKYLTQVYKAHDELVKELRDTICALPVTAVHGDLGATNNIAMTERGIGLFDFDNAGDEALVVDLFSTWYGSIRCLREKGMIVGESPDLLDAYIEGYGVSRKFTESELAVIQVASALFRGLHACRYYLEAHRLARESEGMVLYSAFQREEWIESAARLA